MKLATCREEERIKREESSVPIQSGAADSVSASSGGGYQRRSSGLVRDFSQTDTWMYNVLAMNPVIVGALTFGLVLITYPHANLWLCFVIAGLFCCAEAVATRSSPRRCRAPAATT